MLHRAARGLPLILLVAMAVALQGQQSDGAPSEALARRVNERIRALQREADRLAGEARTLIGDLRRLEIERDLAAERAMAAEAEFAAARAALEETSARLAALEARRVAQLPDLKAQLVDLYKRGRGGYVRLLLEADSVRNAGRTTRAVAALMRINQMRVESHRQTVAALRRERATRAQQAEQLRAADVAARGARAAADRAVAARTRLIARIDEQRDLNAQLAGELQVAYDRLQQQIANVAAGRGGEAVAVPIALFRGALPWPASGRVSAPFRGANRSGGGTVRNGIEIAAAAGLPVTAVHGGTVAFAEAFTGFGNLVIVEHGANTFSLYGYLATTVVERGQTVEAGTEVGRVGSAPAGGDALYFELRVDGQSVDPVQWLERR